MTYTIRRSVFAAVIVAAAGLCAGRAVAQSPTNTWIATVSGNWSVGANWDTNPNAPTSGLTTVLQFNSSGSLAYTATNDIGSPFQLNGMFFNSSSSATTTIPSLAADSVSFVANGAVGPFLLQNNTGTIILSGASTTTGTVTFAANTVFGGGGTGGVTISAPVVFQGTGLGLTGLNTTTVSNSTAGAGTSLPSGGLTITGNGIGNAAFTGLVTGMTAAVTISTGSTSFATGFVQFSGANTFIATGGIALQSGILAIGGTGTAALGPLGPTTNTLTISGGALRASASATIFNPISMNNTDLVFAGTSAATLNGAISVSGTSGLQVLGTGGLTINSTDANNGPTVVGAPGLVSGTLTIGSTATTNGGLLNTTAVTVSTAAASTTAGGLVLGTASQPTATRLSATVPIILNSGRLTYVAGTGTNSQTLSNVTVNGFGGIGTQTTAAGTTLTFGNLILANNATVGFRGSIGTGGNSTVSFTNGPFTGLAPAASGTTPIIPWAPALNSTSGNTNSLNSLVTPDGNGVRVLSNSSGTDFSILTNGSALSADANNFYGSNSLSPAAIAASTTLRVNSIVLSDGTATPIVSGGQGSVLQVFSGAVMAGSGGQANFTVPTLDFGAHTGYLYPSSTLRVNSSITGSAGLVVSGYAGSAGGIFMVLNGSNPVSGGLTVNGSVAVQFVDDQSLGAPGAPITLGRSH